MVNFFYLFLLLLILVIFYLIIKKSFSKEVLSKNPTALFQNNSLIVFEIILILFVFLKFSLITGFITLAVVFIFYMVLGMSINKEIEKELFKK